MKITSLKSILVFHLKQRINRLLFTVALQTSGTGRAIPIEEEIDDNG